MPQIKHQGVTYNFPEGATDEQINGFMEKVKGGNTTNYLDDAGRVRTTTKEQREKDLAERQGLDEAQGLVKGYEDNTGAFAMFSDVWDGFQARNEGRRLADEIREAQKLGEPQEYVDSLISDFTETMEAGNLYFSNERDNIATSSVKELLGAVPVIGAAVGGGAATGFAAGSVAPGPGNVIGGVVGGATGVGVGVYDSFNAFQAQNLLREYQESGDITEQDVKDSRTAATKQAAIFGVVDALTFKTGGKLLNGASKSVTKDIVDTFKVGAALGATGGVAASAIQRDYIDELGVLGEGAMREYAEAAIVGGLIDGATGAAFTGAGHWINPKAIQTRGESDIGVSDVMGQIKEEARNEQAQIADQREEQLLLEDLRDQAVRPDGVVNQRGESFVLYRNSDAAEDTGNIYSSDKDKGSVEEEVTFSNRLDAETLPRVNEALGIDKNASAKDTVTAARDQGHDGVSYTDKDGNKKYIHIPENGTAPARRNTGSQELADANKVKSEKLRSDIRNAQRRQKRAEEAFRLASEEYSELQPKDKAVGAKSKPSDDMLKSAERYLEAERRVAEAKAQVKKIQDDYAAGRYAKVSNETSTPENLGNTWRKITDDQSNIPAIKVGNRWRSVAKQEEVLRKVQKKRTEEGAKAQAALATLFPDLAVRLHQANMKEKDLMKVYNNPRIQKALEAQDIVKAKQIEQVAKGNAKAKPVKATQAAGITPEPTISEPTGPVLKTDKVGRPLPMDRQNPEIVSNQKVEDLPEGAGFSDAVEKLIDNLGVRNFFDTYERNQGNTSVGDLVGAYETYDKKPSKLPFLQDWVNMARSNPYAGAFLEFTSKKANLERSGQNAARQFGRRVKDMLGDDFETTVRLMDQLDQKKGRRNADGLWEFDGPEGTTVLDKSVSDKLDAVHSYFYLPVEMARQSLINHVRKVQQNTPEQDVSAEIALIKKATALKDTAYYPHHRDGDYFIKVGKNAVYAISRQRVPKPKGRLRLTGQEYVDSGKWKELRQRIKNEQGEDIGATPKFFSDKGKDAPAGVVFRKDNYSDLNASVFDSVLSDSYTRDYVKRALGDEAAGDFFDNINTASQMKRRGIEVMLDTTRKNYDGYDKDVDRVWNRHRKTLDNVFSYQMADSLHDMVKGLSRLDSNSGEVRHFKYITNADGGGDDVGVTAAVARAQSFLGLAFSPATAMINTSVLASSYLMAVAPAEINPAVIAGSLAKTSPKALKIAGAAIKDPSVMYDKTKLANMIKKGKKASKEELSIAEDMIQQISLFEENQTMDWQKSKTEKFKDKPMQKGFESFEEAGYWMMSKTDMLVRLNSYLSFRDLISNPKRKARMIRTMEQEPGFKEMMENRGGISEEAFLANYVVRRANGVFGKEGRADYQKSLVGRLVFPFASHYTQMSNQFISTITANGARLNKESYARVLGGAAITTLTLGAAFGLNGVPFFDVWEDSYALWNRYVNKVEKSGFDDLMKAADNMGLSDEEKELLRAGVLGRSNLYIGNRTTFGNPFTSVTDLVTQRGASSQEIGFLLPRLSDSIAGIERGEGLRNVAPVFIQNILKAVDYGGDKGVSTKAGVTIVASDDVSQSDRLLRSVGFESTNLAARKRSYYAARRVSTSTSTPYRNARYTIADHLRSIKENPQNAAEYREAIAEEIKTVREAYKKAGRTWDNADAKNLMRSAKRVYLNQTHGTVDAETGAAANLGSDAKAELERMNRAQGIE
jgi:hypothetical protein